MKRKRLSGACLILAAALAFTCIFTSDKLPLVFASQTADTDELEEQRQETQEKIDDIKSDIKSAKEKIENLENSKSSLQSYISQLDQEANELERRIQELNGEITDKEAEVEQARVDLAEAEAVAEKQYEDMKKRIQYLYENGTPSMLELLLTSDSIADFLNRSTYASQMTRYDRDMLNEYIAQKEAVEQKKQELERSLRSVTYAKERLAEEESDKYMAYRMGNLSQKDYVEYKMCKENRLRDLEKQEKNFREQEVSLERDGETYLKAVRALKKLKNEQKD